MSLPEAIRVSFIERMMDHLDSLSATAWEARGHHVAQLMLRSPLRHRGQTVSGNPVGYTVDSYSWQGTSVVEFSVEPKYFLDLKKPQRDYEHAREKHPQAEVVLLMSTQPGKSGVATDVANWENEVRERDGVLLLVADAQEIAEFFADEVVPNQSASDILAPFFEPLQRLQAEYAATNTIPTQGPGVLQRQDLERSISQALDVQTVVVLAGMSGLGKSETAIAVANARIGRHDWRVWIRRDQITALTDLQAIDVSQRGVKLNLLGMLRTRRCLLVVDDVPSSILLGQLIALIRDECGPGSAVLITSQQSHDGPENVNMPFLEESEARILLQQGVVDSCPNELFVSILQYVGGHPMALGMLNGSAKEGLQWKDVAFDASRVGSLPVLARPGVLASVVLERWRQAIEAALGFFIWARTSRVHEELCRRAVTYGAVRAVRRLGLLAGDQVGAIRLHDIAWAATRDLNPPILVNDESYANATDIFVRELSGEDAGALTLNQLARLHQAILAWLIQSNFYRHGHLYAWLHYPGPGAIRADDLPDPLGFATTVAKDASDDFAVQTAAELAEATLRLRLQERSSDAAGPTDSELLEPFEILLGSHNLSNAAQHHVRHHHAKALKRLKRWLDASAACEALLRDAGPLASTRLLLARTLTEYPKELASAETGARARDLLYGLLAEADAAPGRSSISVTLAAAELLRRNAVHADFNFVFEHYSSLLENLILEAVQRGLEQATLAFGALGMEWAKRDPQAFKRVFTALPIPAADSIENWDELTAWGEILKAAAEQEVAARREELLRTALSFFSRAQTRYAATHHADTYTLLGEPHEAVRILSGLLAHDFKVSADVWIYQRRSEAYHALGDELNAASDACTVCEILQDANRHTPYFLKWYATRLISVGRTGDARQQLARLKAWLESKGRGNEWDDSELIHIHRPT